MIGMLLGTSIIMIATSTRERQSDERESPRRIISGYNNTS